MTTRCMYLRDYNKSNRHPVGCILMEVDLEKKQIKYAFTACSPKDKFDKVQAIKLTTLRFQKRPRIIETEIPKSSHGITRLIMESIVSCNERQSKDISRSLLALEAASNWLRLADQNYEKEKK